MLAVLSDLHFSEARSTRLGNVCFNKNPPIQAFRDYFSELNQYAHNHQIQTIDLVLAGDILDIIRSGSWFSEKERPYCNNYDVMPDGDNEKAILRIIRIITSEERVSESIHVLKHIQDYFDAKVNLHYILGNHDRLINATPLIRSTVRGLFGLPDGEVLFKHHYIYPSSAGTPLCLVRHGHEYDGSNFSVNTETLEVIPNAFSEDEYGTAPIGDITSTEFGAALLYYFREIYGAERILNDPVLLALYECMMEFDDVRPETALLAYFFSTPGISNRQVWKLMAPCFHTVQRNLIDNERFVESVAKSPTLSSFQQVLFKKCRALGLLNLGLPFFFIKQLMKRLSKEIRRPPQVQWVRKEALVRDASSGCKCVVSGHTHFPEVSLITAKNGDERYYINSGTWRNSILATRNLKEFGRLNALTKVIVTQASEMNSPKSDADWSFRFLSGVSYRT